jgi:GNAT superfamily N-acetyltransferase
MLRLRPLTAEDRAAIAEFVLNDPDHTRTCFDREPSPADADDLLSSAAYGSGDVTPTLLGAFDADGALVGLIDWACRWPTPATGYIGLLQVRPGHRRQGVATALLTHAQEAAAAAGCRQLMLAVIARNEPARAFWERLGFQWLAPQRARRATPLEAVVMHRPIPAPQDGTRGEAQPAAAAHAAPAVGVPA